MIYHGFSEVTVRSLQLVGGAITILKNDGVRPWLSDDIPYMKWKVIKFHGSKPPKNLNLPRHISMAISGTD